MSSAPRHRRSQPAAVPLAVAVAGAAGAAVVGLVLLTGGPGDPQPGDRSAARHQKPDVVLVEPAGGSTPGPAPSTATPFDETPTSSAPPSIASTRAARSAIRSAGSEGSAGSADSGGSAGRATPTSRAPSAAVSGGRAHPTHPPHPPHPTQAATDPPRP